MGPGNGWTAWSALKHIKFGSSMYYAESQLTSLIEARSSCDEKGHCSHINEDIPPHSRLPNPFAGDHDSRA